MLILLLACLNSTNKTNDTDSDGPPVPDCDAAAFDGVLPLDPDGPDTQIHIASAFDGERIWMAWNRPSPSGAFQVFVSAMDCDGTVQVAPFRVDTGPENQLDPALAVNGDRVLVAWQSDNSNFPDNLDLRYRVLDRVDGAPVNEVIELAPTRAGQLFTGNLWMASVAADGDGWVLAGTAGVDGGFRAFLVELDADGMTLGDLIEPLPDPSITQQVPQVVVDSEGTAHLVFLGSGEVDEAYYSEDGGPAVSMGEGSFPSIGAQGRFIGFSRQGAVWFGPLGSPQAVGPDGNAVAVGAAGAGGFVGWYKNVSGFANEIKIARFDASGVVGARLDLGTQTAAPYGWNLTPISESLVFVAWQEGESPAFRTYGKFIRP